MATEILMPALSPTMEEGTLAKWMVKEGDSVSSGDLLAEIETDKATMEFEAVDDGIIGKILVAAGTDDVKVNTPIAILLEEGEELGPAKTAEQPPEPASAQQEAAPQETAKAPPPKTGDRVFASPLARRLAKQKGLDLAEIRGSGPHGRIVKADVDAAEQPAAVPEQAAAPQTRQPEGPKSASSVASIFADRPFTEVSLDGMRKTIAARLTEAKQTIPHFYLRRAANLDALLTFRTELNAQLAPSGKKLSVNDFVIKACARALQSVPHANAVWAEDRILQMQRSDVAVAVAIEGGLFTPVIKDADQKSISALSQEMKDLAARARERKLAPSEYVGGTFAISNLGMFGIENFDAVINPPHAAILAVGAGVKKPTVDADGAVTVATQMSMTLSVDHRVIDGSVGAALLAEIVSGLENPLLLLA
ncbi:pyruvate dehydrogenase complex dihydrolipoamide acetyltransferase [Dinoroseobacter sp. PD6]|uniref:pyruvate dehydrogenase complex dihydrolipoamide acetyltransferase n=1 Tax=Dinoroseobacter sp. PD6 TaxID=3028384 RepID=UPI00237B1BF5|nr:pyruvate dehydrogenase complex dihydrolipoamide acetyltransferase [Dinoroseobacter sp. PD6]MDD9716589.1 pyruvate dehydrogenase complex dihydrolipoamide acetyltransferase [Dinoroseobacter sp. PD6]